MVARRREVMEWASVMEQRGLGTEKQFHRAEDVFMQQHIRQLAQDLKGEEVIQVVSLLTVLSCVKHASSTETKLKIAAKSDPVQVTAVKQCVKGQDKMKCYKQQISASRKPVCLPKLGSNGSKQKASLAKAQRRCRDVHWQLVREACASKDHKEFSKGKEWRRQLLLAHSALLKVCNSASQKLAQATNIVRSEHSGRAQIDVNPTQVAVALQPAVDEGRITKEQAQTMVRIATDGISVEEFRELTEESLDLSDGNTKEPEDHEILLDFYFAQAARGRCFLFPESDAVVLDSQGALVVSPSFLVRVLGKNPRPICNLSSNGNNGVNQMMDDFEANADGYTTIPNIAKLVVQSYVDMVLNPEVYDIDDVSKIDLSMLVADAADAFTRVSVSPEVVGMQATRVAGITIVPMCCLFGWRRSAEVFSHVTASILATFQSNLDSATFLRKDLADEYMENGYFSLPEQWRKLITDRNHEHSHLADAHVDDFCTVEEVHGKRHIGAAADLIWSIKSHLGAASISVKKFLQSSFWTVFQKVIGAWFNVETFNVTMPQEKIEEVIGILDSDAFNEEATEFEIDLCATLRGKLRWALLATKLGDSPALINIEKRREPHKSNKRKVKPMRHHGESQELATAKFKNDMHVYRLLMYACRDNPAVASCSMVSMLTLEQRLAVPGQSKWLVWLSGDFSMKAQSYGIELWHPVHGHEKFYCVIMHPQATIDALRRALAGDSVKGTAIVSTVCERLNKLMCEFQFRKLIAGRPCICLEDNQGSVACINSGYSSHVLMQAMQLASNLRQAIDEAPMESHYTNTLNMSWFDQTSRLNYKFAEKMNADLAKLNLPVWVEVPVCEQTAGALNEWLPMALEQDMPMLKELIDSLGGVAAAQHMPVVSLNYEEVSSKLDTSWQKRVQAAAQPISHYMGSFGPGAYSLDHLTKSDGKLGATEQNWNQLRRTNDQLAKAKCYSMFDSFHGGCGGSVAAIKAGVFVQAGADWAVEEMKQFQALTGRASLGDVRVLCKDRLPKVHIWFSCSSCKDFSSLGSKKGIKGTKGGSLFTKQFDDAKAAGAKVVILENVDGVATLAGGIALKQLIENAVEAGYSQLFHKKIVFALFGDPENRSRRVIVAFHDSVVLSKQWKWPEPSYDNWSLDHNNRKCAGEILFPSTLVPARYWDDRPWQRVKKSWTKRCDLRIKTMGYKSLSSIGTPLAPSNVWLPSGLFPTCLASGNSGLVLTIMLRALCPLYCIFTEWFELAHGKKGRRRRQTVKNLHHLPVRPSRKIKKGGLRTRRPMPIETLISKGFPKDTPMSSDEVGFRFAGNAVPCDWFSELFKMVVDQLEGAGVSHRLIPGAKQYSTWVDEPLHLHDFIDAKKLGANDTKKGHNIVHKANREKMATIPVVPQELELMSAQGEYFKDGRYVEDSKIQIAMSWAHWRSFCLRFGRPLYLRIDTLAEVTAAAQQARMFLHYETALFHIKAQSVVQKIWAVGSRHKAAYYDDPFAGNQLLRATLSDAIALDEPQKPKIPLTNETLRTLRSKLNLHERKGFTTWVGIRFAIAFLCRVSEWAVKDKHTLKWKHLNFYTSKHSAGGRQRMVVRTIQDIYKVAELQVIFYSDKTTRRGGASAGAGKARSFHAIPNISDSRCIVRDMARLWLVSEQCAEYDVFAWGANTQGTDRKFINSILQEAAVETGIPGADVSSHSLRRTGLCRLMGAKVPMSWAAAREYGRWESDCAFRYFWPSTELAIDFAEDIWDSSTFEQ